MKIAWKWALWGLAGSALLFVPGPARAEAETVEHTVRSGDNLHLIAAYYYRDPRQWRKVWKLNRKGIANPSRLVPGKSLRIDVSSGWAWDIPYEDFLTRVHGK